MYEVYGEQNRNVKNHKFSWKSNCLTSFHLKRSLFEFSIVFFQFRLIPIVNSRRFIFGLRWFNYISRLWWIFLESTRFHRKFCFIFRKLIAKTVWEIRFYFEIFFYQNLLRNDSYPGVFESISSRDIKICTHGIFRLTTIGSRPSIIGSHNSSFLFKKENKYYCWKIVHLLMPSSISTHTFYNII